jgi:hypothetical protein
MNAKTVVAEALDLAKIRLNEMPSFPIYASCVAQLEYLLSVINGELPIDRQKLRTIIIGHYGLREFDDTDPVFAKVLKDAQLIASNMADGLKVL